MTRSEQGPIEFTSTSVEHTLALGRSLARELRGGDVVGLVGPLGAGKTQLVRGIAAGLGMDERAVSSPTFVLMSEYESATGGVPVVHIDAYRMQGLSGLESIGWSAELFEGAVTLVEWADRIAEHLPEDHLLVELSHAGDDQREVTIRPGGDWAGRMDGLRRTVSGVAAAARDAERPCPICGRPVAEAAAGFPFCSERCRLVDLNKWFSGQYRISSTPDEARDLDDPRL